MSEFAGNLPRKFISFRHLGVESKAHELPEERELEDPQNVAEMKETMIMQIGETCASSAKDLWSRQEASVGVECVGAGLGHEDRELTRAEKDCVLTSSDEDVEDLSAFVAERLQCLGEEGGENQIGSESMNVEEILCGSTGVGEDGRGNRQSVYPNVTGDEGIVPGGRRLSQDDEVNRVLLEDLGSTAICSTPKKAVWPIYTKRRSSVLDEPGGPVCKAVMLDVGSGSGTVGAAESRGNVTMTSGGVPESVVTSGGFSVLESIARRQADERIVGTGMDEEREGMVRVPPVDELLGHDFSRKERTKYYPSQSAKSLLKDCFALNPPTCLDPSHPTTSFSADQMIQFARAVGLEVSLASYSMLEDSLLKARRGSGDHFGTARYPAGRSPFPSVAGSTMGDSVASLSVYSMPTIGEDEDANVIARGDVPDEPCSSRQADERLAMGIGSSERPETDSLKTLQQIKSSQKKKKL